MPTSSPDGALKWRGCCVASCSFSWMTTLRSSLPSWFMLSTAVFSWVFLHQKAYQAKEEVKEVSVVSKLKGVSATGDVTMVGSGKGRVWDVAEYVVPSQGSHSFAVIIRTHETRGQQLGLCPEVENIVDANCKNDTDCLPKAHDFLLSGKKTGRCVLRNPQASTCELFAWCPVENEDDSMGNLRPGKDMSYLRGCQHDSITNNYCPIFALGNIYRQIFNEDSTFTEKGAVLAILIDWSCNLDLGEQNCHPKYSFKRLDIQGKGYNFRFARHHTAPNGTDIRVLIKAYAIRFDIIVSGMAGKFDIIPTVINTAAALTSFGLVSLICDWLLLNFSRERNAIRNQKFEEVSQGKNTSATPSMVQADSDDLLKPRTSSNL
uniref:P2X purinoceptor n=1 Tax=Eptatretus burgeri TaxID=7764 RepID=A0A8C4WUR8_EPTBU